MKKFKLTKTIAGTLVIVSILLLNPIAANAEWIENSEGKWYAENNSWVTGWKQIDGKCYYFDENGYMVKDKEVDGWYFNDSGVGTKCIKFGEFEIDKSTGTIAKFVNEDAFWRPGSIGISVIIPSKIGGVDIKCIGGHAFDNCNNISKVTLPDSITSIGNSAFDECDKLTSINIPNQVTSIGDYAFSSCYNLTGITIPTSVKNIGEGAFDGCNKLTNMTIPEGVTSIGDWTFRGCSSLTSITLPDSITSIGDSAFDSCDNLTNITIPNNVKSIGRTAFWGCSSLTSITIPDSVRSIEDEAFSGCKDTIFYVGNEDVKYVLTSYSGIENNKIIIK